MNEFAERLKELRKDNHLTQTQLATKLGVTQSTVGKWETGERVPNIEIFILISKTFHRTIDWLVGLEL